jgi:hypothetical protein
MTNEDDRLVLRIDDALGRGNVAFERQRRVLDDADAVAVLLQQAVDPCQPEPSTKPPWTRTTVPDPAMMSSFERWGEVTASLDRVQDRSQSGDGPDRGGLIAPGNHKERP